MARRWGKKDMSARRPLSSDLPNQFARNRTISAYTPVSAPDLNRISAHTLRRHRRSLLQVLGFSFGVIIVTAFLATQLTARIGMISYAPATLKQPDETAIRSAVDEYYASRPLERLRPFLNQGTLGQFLANKLPEIKGVQSVGGDGLGSMRLALNMRVPVASWQIGGKTLYVDSDGVAFTNLYYAQPAVTVDDQSGATSLGSSAIASSSMIRYIGQLIAALQNDGTGTVTKVVLPAGMIRELDIYLQGRAYRVKVQLDRDVTSQAADVKAAVTYIDAHGGTGQYVDCRVPGKAFYQ